MNSSTPRDAVRLSPNAVTVLEKRYLVKDDAGKPVEAPQDLFWRVGRTIAEADRRYGASVGGAEAVAGAFYGLMADRLFVPNSPTLMNAGRPLGQLSACFVLPVDDALSNGRSGIYDTLRAMALVHQSGGGTGFSFSRLRPKNDIVRSTMGVASGPVSFMTLFDASTDVVKQGGTRRGANMGILRVDHPDIMEFITCKDDTTKITNFNISVAVTDAFMAAVEADTAYDLIHPKTKRVTGQLQAREVWGRIIHGAWKTGEPGVFFIDKANHYNPVPHLGSYEATNPCHRGDNLVHTTLGLVPIRDLVGKDFGVVTPTGEIARASAFVTGVQALYRVRFDNGMCIDLTANHKLITEDGTETAVRDLHTGARIQLATHPIEPIAPQHRFTEEEGMLLGWNAGDGWITFHSNKKVRATQVGFVFGKADGVIAQWVENEVATVIGERQPRLKHRPERGIAELATTSKAFTEYFLNTLGAVNKRQGVPVTVMRGSREFQRGYLRGLFSSDGYVAVKGAGKKERRQLGLVTAHERLAQDVQFLLSTFGIVSRLRYSESTLPGRVKRYARWQLSINADQFVRFVRQIGFMPGSAKQEVAERVIQREWRDFASSTSAGVVSVEALDLAEPVFNLTVNHPSHRFAVNGVISANCGEQPLLPYDVCNLGSINLGAFVRDGQIDWDHLRRVVHLSTHFLENVIDANQYPLAEITDLAQRIRRIGLGVMGLADLFVKLGIPYDSEEGVALGRKLQQFVDEEAKVESERLATERGVFPEWERSIWGPDQTCARGPDGERVRPMRRLRNCNVTTVAPTGTISIIAGCSSGIEPLFAVAFMRNQAGVLMPDVNEDFVAIAKAEGWHSEGLMRRIAEAGHIEFPEVPPKWRRVFVTANHIKPEWHIRMQAAFQEYNDSAISKTCNFAHDATEAYVEEIYRLAYRLNCKGVTVYRDGSRDMQVLSTGSTAKKVQEQATATGKAEARADLAAPAPGAAVPELKGQLAELEAENERLRRMVHDLEAENLQRRQKRSRPELLRGNTRRLETPLGTLYVTVTEDDRGQPFEVFMSLGKAGGALMADVEALGRLISLALRSGIPMKEIYRQLRGISSDRVIGLGPNKVLSVPDAVGIAIERWMQEKQGIQQELLPGGTPADQLAPVVAPRSAYTGPGGEQMVFGGLQETLSGACPDCGSQLEFAEGCMKCHVCGFSECG